MLEFFNGVPEILVPDNLKSGVNKACRYDPELNPSYQQLAEHYHLAYLLFMNVYTETSVLFIIQAAEQRFHQE